MVENRYKLSYRSLSVAAHFPVVAQFPVDYVIAIG